MLNLECVKKDNHRWGVCLQVCAQCGVNDLVTVNLCEDSSQYVCYKCGKAGA